MNCPWCGQPMNKWHKDVEVYDCENKENCNMRRIAHTDKGNQAWVHRAQHMSGVLQSGWLICGGKEAA